MSILNIKKLHVNVDGKPILNGVDLEVKSGEVHAIMGPNGRPRRHAHLPLSATQACTIAANSTF